MKRTERLTPAQRALCAWLDRMTLERVEMALSCSRALIDRASLDYTAKSGNGYVVPLRRPIAYATGSL